MAQSKTEILKDAQAAQCEIRIPDTEWMASAYFVMVDDNLVLSEVRLFPAEDRLPEGAKTSAELRQQMTDLASSLRRRKRPTPPIGEWSRTSEGVLDPEGITIRLMREVRLADLFEPVQEWARWLLGDEPSGLPGEYRKIAGSSNPGRRPRDDVYFAEWARLISERTTDPTTRTRPIAAVADAAGLSRGQVRDIAHEARRRRLLSDPPSGARGGGMLTDKARGLLASTAAKGKK